MAIKKNAAKANIGPKKQVKATFAECTAENPLKCKYHGLKAFDNLINSCLAKNGMVAAFVTDKKDDGYELRCSPDTIFGKAWEDILNALHEKGLNLVSKGNDPETGALVYKAQENDKGISYEAPDGEAELEDADTLSSSKAPENNTASKSTVTKKDPFAELENIDTDALIAENELDADLLDNFDELDEVVGEVTEDLESELLGNTDFDDDVFADETEEDQLPKDLTDEQIKDLVSFKGITDEHFEQNPGLMDSYKAIILHGLNPNWSPLNDSQKAWWNDLLDKTKNANEDELPALKALKATMAKVNGKQEPSSQEITEADCVELMKAAGHNPNNYGEDAPAAWLHLFKTGENGYGNPISGTILGSWKSIAKKAEASGKNLAALPVLKATLAKLEGREKQKTLTDDDIVEAFNPIYDPTEDGPLGKNTHNKEFYKSVLTNPSGHELVPSQLAWFKEASEKAHAAGVDNYALELLDKMLVAKGVMKNGGDNNEAEMEKCKAKWNNLMDTAINGKKLQGTQYWAESIQPIVEAYNEAIADNNVVHAFDAVYDLKNAVKDAPENGSSKPPTKDSLIAEMGNVISKMKSEGLDLTWDAKKGNALGKAFEDAINAEDIEGATKALDNFKEYVEFLESGGDAPEDDEESISTEDIKDFFNKCGIKKESLLTEANLAATKEALETGKFKGKALTAANKKWYAALAKKAPDHKVANAINEMLSADKMPHKAKKKGSTKEALSSALSGSNESMVAEGMLQPLEHDESKFPQNVTQKELDDAIKKGKKLGGHGGLGTRLVEISGKKYVCKAATGTGASVIRNGFNADMAYRAGGVYAPDAQLYEFGDGKTYKLSEFIPGKRLIDVWQTADEAKRDEIRKELLKGYPLDVLFSNYDVLGTSPEDSITVTIQGADGKPQKTHVAFNNIMIGDDGHAYRVDNDGSFAMTGTGGIKHSSGGGYTTKVEAEKWGKWEDRQWIDDFRTLRRNEKNLGIFDRYSTADIFLSAGNINLDAVVGTLPQGIQKALAKPLFEMKQMTWRAVNMALGGYKNNGFVSMALDASYEASKRRLRELSAKSVSWNDSGFGEYKSHWGNYSPQPFGENPPEKPQDPTTALADKLKNEEYTGSKIGSIIFSAAKTINYHGGEKKFDEKGNPIGNPMSDPDYKPNAAKIAEWEKIDRDKLAELAKTDANAKILLGLYDTIAYSKENGWKKPIGLVPSGLTIQGKLAKDYLSPTEKKIHDDMAGAIAEYKAKMSVYQKELAEYEKRKDAHKKKEEEKAKAAGGSPYHNFHDFAKALMEEGIDTNGIAHRIQTNGIAPIESSMGAQKGSSYADSAVKWKVREMMALGFTPEQILEMAAQKKLYKGNYYTSCINNQLLPHKDEWDRDMASQAMYLGMNMVKMENEHNDLYDKKSGVVFLNRNIGNIPQGLTAEEKKIYSTSSTTGWVGPHVDSAADCMQFEANWWHEPYKQVYAVPLSRIVCCANNDMATGGGYGYGSEQEYVGNLYNLPCWVYHDNQNLTWKGAIDEANKTSGMKGFLKKLASRLGFFSTLPKK